VSAVSKDDDSGSSLMQSYSVPKLKPASPPKLKPLEYTDDNFIEQEQRELRNSLNSVGFDGQGGIVRSNVTYYGGKSLPGSLTEEEELKYLNSQADKNIMTNKVLSSRSKLKKSNNKIKLKNDEVFCKSFFPRFSFILTFF